MKHDLSQLDWTLACSTPFLWRFEKTMEVGAHPSLEFKPIPARVPGSVQSALLAAGIIEDWNVGTNSRKCEWVENRHWIFRANLPDDRLTSRNYRLVCMGLDYSGWVLVNGKEVSTFSGSFTPHTFDISQFLIKSGNVLEIIFDIPPRWLGQFGYTSQMREWKPRFNYTWDWIPRLVQIGIWDKIYIEPDDEPRITEFACTTGLDSAAIKGEARGGANVRLSLSIAGSIVREEEFPSGHFEVDWRDLPVEPWWPNGEGEQPMYTVECVLLDDNGNQLDVIDRKIGFRHIEWAPCDGSPGGADPWVCVVNDRPVFLAGVNWAPIRPNFADLTEADYRKRLQNYKDLGFNTIRINGCGFGEHDWLYDICDELGILIWQDFPLSSSGIDNWPPEDEKSIHEMGEIARWYVTRLKHHPSILLWCGGNELQGDEHGNKFGIGKPVTLEHPMIAHLNSIVREMDPQRRFVASSPSGPSSGTSPGKGMNWDVHGPYASFDTPEKAGEFWEADDSLFRSEVCAPGASPIDIIRKYKGDFDEYPSTKENPYWARPTPWWIEADKFIVINGNEPKILEEYVAWSQTHQAFNLALAYKYRKERFPRNGGILIWTGHDTFPIPTNASILDFNGDMKPAAHAISKVLQKGAEK